MEVGLADAPRADEILLILVNDHGRARARAGRRLEGVGDQGSGRAGMNARIRKLATLIEETHVEMARASRRRRARRSRSR
jgi:hypothetical protein